MTNKEEAISREEAIKYLKWIRPINPYSLDRIKVQQAIDLAIGALNRDGTIPYEKGESTVCVCPVCGSVWNIKENENDGY